MKRVFAVLLFALSCEGSGCLPGDFINQCSKTCGAAGVRVATPQCNVCVCGEVKP